MIMVSRAQFDRFERNAELAFLARLGGYLSARHPAFLPRFAPPVQAQIVAMMVARARRAGATWQSTIALFCDLMEAVAPNFHRDPELAATIGSPDPESDPRIRSLADRVDARVWAQAERNRSDLDLYVPPELDHAPVAERIAAALPVILWDRVPAAAAGRLATRATELARRLGFESLEDAPLAVAAWRTLYAGAGDSDARRSWAADIIDLGVPARQRLAALRLRIMIDHRRRA